MREHNFSPHHAHSLQCNCIITLCPSIVPHQPLSFTVVTLMFRSYAISLHSMSCVWVVDLRRVCNHHQLRIVAKNYCIILVMAVFTEAFDNMNMGGLVADWLGSPHTPAIPPTRPGEALLVTGTRTEATVHVCDVTTTENHDRKQRRRLDGM